LRCWLQYWTFGKDVKPGASGRNEYRDGNSRDITQM
jgi:hypothetical protein